MMVSVSALLRSAAMAEKDRWKRRQHSSAALADKVFAKLSGETVRVTA